MSRTKHASPLRSAITAAFALLGLAASPAALAWEPTKPVEFIVPAGTGGGADQMARFIQGVVAKNNLMKQPLVVVNKSGGAGAEGFLAVKGDKGDPHKIIITLSNLFTTPLATGVPFNWRDLTPVQMLALDQFVLWVNADSPYKTAKEYFEAVKKGDNNAFKMAGTGSKQEDQIITVMFEKAAGKKVTYVPFKGGGDVAVQLVGNHVNSTVNNPIEAESHWKGGKLRPLCVMDKQPLPYEGWKAIPTCTSAGVPIEYVMLRGIFMTPGVTPEQVKYYQDLFAKVRELPEWKEFMQKGAFNQSALTGDAFFEWLGKNEQMHRVLMKDAGFLAK